MIMIVHQVIYYRVSDSVDDVDVDKSSLSRLARATFDLYSFDDIVVDITDKDDDDDIKGLSKAYTVVDIFHNTERS